MGLRQVLVEAKGFGCLSERSEVFVHHFPDDGNILLFEFKGECLLE